jgi:hypothetical protein
VAPVVPAAPPPEPALLVLGPTGPPEAAPGKVVPGDVDGSVPGTPVLLPELLPPSVASAAGAPVSFAPSDGTRATSVSWTATMPRNGA